MREIKFRVWDDGDMVYFKLWETEEYPYVQSIDGTWQNIETGDEVELMQFTGLEDKKEKEIYEGDIVKWGLPRREPKRIMTETVKFITQQDDNCGFYPFLGGGDCCGCLPQAMANEVEIIGNIYENAELLK